MKILSRIWSCVTQHIDLEPHHPSVDQLVDKVVARIHQEQYLEEKLKREREDIDCMVQTLIDAGWTNDDLIRLRLDYRGKPLSDLKKGFTRPAEWPMDVMRMPQDGHQ